MEVLNREREEKEQMMMQMAAMEAQSQAYKNTQKAAEEGSPAKEMAGV